MRESNSRQGVWSALCYHYTNENLAESIGIEPMHPFLNDGLANRCLATRPTFQILEEDVRFELTDLLQPLVFKTSAIDHSANLPLLLVEVTENRTCDLLLAKQPLYQLSYTPKNKKP